MKAAGILTDQKEPNKNISRTVFVGKRSRHCANDADTSRYIGGPGPGTPNCHVNHPWSFHPGGSNMLLADGSVHMITDDIELATYRFLGQRDDGSITNWP